MKLRLRLIDVVKAAIHEDLHPIVQGALIDPDKWKVLRRQ